MHIPVMLKEVISVIKPSPSIKILDCTFGRGGHTKEFLSHGATVYGLDRDYDAFLYGSSMSFSRFYMFRYKFSDLPILNTKFDAVFFDLGVSSPQIDNPNRGMSFNKDGPLDMRMGINQISAFDFVNNAPENVIADVIYNYGDEVMSRSIAKKIVQYRKIKTINTTVELANLIKTIVRTQGINPATRTFQAIRIYVNDEIQEISMALHRSPIVLKQGGIICCISFHSIEDRVVKAFCKKFDHRNKVIKPSSEEIALNKRSRSAKMRYIRVV